MRRAARLGKCVCACGSVLIVATALAGGVWIVGCSSDSARPTAGDGGASDASAGGDSTTHVDAAADAGGDTSTQLPVSCENYCSLVKLNCTGQNDEYIDKPTCLAMCARLTLGTLPDTTGDTIACRQTHAVAAQGNPSGECPSAGPTGGDTCGTDHCASWCALEIAQCGTIAFTAQAPCVTACDALTYTKSAGDIANISGNTMNCRIYHVEAAYQNDGGLSATHCPHTGVPSVIKNDGGAGPCN